MTVEDTTQTPPAGRIGWMKALLIASLALNLLFIGGAAARMYLHGPAERITGISQMQLVPRRFFGELDRGRRLELLAVFKGFRDQFRDGRKATRDQTVNLAAALEATPYDANAVKTVVESFSRSSSELVGKGGEAALAFIGKLSAEERLLLAKHIRMRDMGGRRKDRKSGDDD
jgi:uncharacterized membrane protein